MIKCFSNGLLNSNVYVLYSKDEAMIIDAGAKCEQISNFVHKNALKVKYIVLTHGHFDHVAYVNDYVCEFPDALIICHNEEIKVLNDPEANVSLLLGTRAIFDLPYTPVRAGHVLSLGDLSIRVLHTPGHTPGSICLYCESEGILFSGDTMFLGSYGRTDFKYGSPSDMRRSLCDLLTLPSEVEVFPGHGDMTKIGWEA